MPVTHETGVRFSVGETFCLAGKGEGHMMVTIVTMAIVTMTIVMVMITIMCVALDLEEKSL